MRNTWKAGLVFAAILAVIGPCAYEGTYVDQIPSDHRLAWEMVNQEVYGGGLSGHDISVVERIAKRHKVGPFRAVMSLAYIATNPSNTYGEVVNDLQSIYRTNQAIADSFLLHPGVQSRIMAGVWGDADASADRKIGGWHQYSVLFPETQDQQWINQYVRPPHSGSYGHVSFIDKR